MQEGEVEEEKEEEYCCRWLMKFQEAAGQGRAGRDNAVQVMVWHGQADPGG